MTKEEFKEIATRRAKENYKSGMNCCESTFKAVFDTLKEAGMTDFPPEVVAIATGFGGGVGSSGNICGALSGAVMAAGIMHGRKNPLEKETLEERVKQMFGPEGVMRLFNNIVHDFKEKAGSANCGEIIKPYEYSSPDRKRYCMSLVVDATGLAVDWLYNGIEKGYSYPYFENIMGAK